MVMLAKLEATGAGGAISEGMAKAGVEDRTEADGLWVERRMTERMTVKRVIAIARPKPNFAPDVDDLVTMGDDVYEGVAKPPKGA
jgi:hypothetical protein